MDDLRAWLSAQIEDDALRVVDMDTVFGDVLESRERAQAEVDFKRRIVAAGPDKHGYVRYGTWKSCSDECPEIVQVEVLKLLALPYATRPGYRDEWRP